MILFNPVKVVTPSSLQAVTLQEAKAHLKIDGDDENTIIQLYVNAAVRRCEDYRQAAIMSAEHELYSSYFEYSYNLQKFPVTAINSVKYYDEDNTLQTVSSSNYRLQDFFQPCRLEFDNNFSAPSVYDREYPVVINFQAGYSSASSVPATIKLGILTELGTYNEFRQSVLAGNGLTSIQIKEVSKELLDADTMWV